MTAYTHLQEMCSEEFVIRVQDTYYTDPISPRLQFIMDQVPGGIMDEYYPRDNVVGQNYYIPFNKGFDDTIVFMAHHDIVNTSSQNCNDNTASICHLIELCHRLKDAELQCNVLVAFVDLEETCSTVLAGSTRLAKVLRHNNKNTIAVYNLELTSCGQLYWFNPYGHQPEINEYLITKEFTKVFTPINDAYHVAANNIPAVCIGSFRDEDYAIVSQGRCGCPLWASCHDDDDSIEKWANPIDMELFNNTLLSLATDYPYIAVD